MYPQWPKTRPSLHLWQNLLDLCGPQIICSFMQFHRTKWTNPWGPRGREIHVSALLELSKFADSRQCQVDRLTEFEWFLNPSSYYSNGQKASQVLGVRKTIDQQPTVTLLSQSSQVLPNPRVPNKCLHHLSWTPSTSNIKYFVDSHSTIMMDIMIDIMTYSNIISNIIKLIRARNPLHYTQCFQPRCGWM